MAEYIERETFLKDIEERYCLPCKEAGRDHNVCKCKACWVDDMRGDVIDAPVADVAPVVHGRWIDMRESSKDVPTCKCSECGCVIIGLEKNYCPNCGARMDASV